MALSNAWDSPWTTLVYALISLVTAAITTNLIQQVFFRDPHKPPIVWHWLPLIGSTAEYGQEPYKFFFRCRKEYGDVFTFGMLGMKVTAYLGPMGNDFILNGKHKDLNAEEVYGPLTIPVFGKGVIYDIDNAKFMDQKRLLKEGFTSTSLRAYVPLFVKETEHFLATNAAFRGLQGGVVDISSVFGELSLYCAAGSLQGTEVRNSLDSTFGQLYRHLDDGFAPINFMFPWLPIPINIRRDRAQRAMATFYMDIITKRRATGNIDNSSDMLWAIMDAHYKDGTPLSDPEIANLMIALLMGGQHNTASSGTWIVLHLAHRPHLIDELYAEQASVLGDKPLTYDATHALTLHHNVIKETLRLHSPIHSIMRKVKTNIPIPGTDMFVPKGHILLAATGVSARDPTYFSDPLKWDPYRWTTTDASSPSPYSSSSSTTTTTATPLTDPVANPSKAASSPYLPFGAGRHRCVGETFAYAQLLGILVTLVRLLQWEQVDPEKDVPETDYSIYSEIATVGVTVFAVAGSLWYIKGWDKDVVEMSKITAAETGLRATRKSVDTPGRHRQASSSPKRQQQESRWFSGVRPRRPTPTNADAESQTESR